MSIRLTGFLLSGFLLASGLSPAQAQNVSCTGIAEWNASTIYNAGSKLVYQGRLYQATTSIWNTSMSGERAARSCWNSPSRSLASLGVEMILTLCPVCAAHASAPWRQSSSSMPTAPHAMATVAANDRPQGTNIGRKAIVSSQHRPRCRRGAVDGFLIDARTRPELNFYFAVSRSTGKSQVIGRPY